MPAVRETFHKRSLYEKIIRQSLFKKPSKNKVKYSRTEKEVLWPTLYRYKGPQMGKKITPPEYKNVEKPVLRSMTSPNKTYFSKISANLNKANTEAELSFEKNQTKNTMPKKHLGYTQTTIQWQVVKSESVYQPLYPYKGNVGQVSQIERTSEDVQMKTKMETTKDVANTNIKEAAMTPTGYPKNNTLNVTKTCEELKNSLSCQKNTSDLNETTKIGQFPSIIEQNQNLSNIKNVMKITKSDEVKNNIMADQNFANKVMFSSEISKNLTTNNYKQKNSELAVQNTNRTRNQLISTNTIGADVQRTGTSNRSNMNNSRPPCHVLTRISWSKRQQQRPVFTSTKVHNRIQSKPLINYNSVNYYSTFIKTSQKESKVLNYLLKMININGETKQAYFPYFGKLYAKNRVLPLSLHKEKKNKWLSIEDIAKIYPINVKSKSVLTKEIEEIKPEQPVTKFSENTSTINKELKTEIINEQPKGNPVKRNKKPGEIRLIVDGPVIWRCEKALSKRQQRVKSNFQHRKEILRSGRGTNKKKLGNLVFSKHPTSRYEPIYSCKHKVTLEKLNADYLQNKAKRITNNVQRSRSDYTLCNNIPYNKFENSSSTKSLKDSPVLVRVNYMSTSQNKQYFNSCTNCAINLDSHNEDNGEEELPQRMRENRTGKSSTDLCNKSKINRTKPMYSDLVLRKNKSVDNYPYFFNKSTQTAKPNCDNLLVEKAPNVFPKNENNLLKSVLENIVTKQKNYGRMLCPMKPPRIFYKKPLMEIIPVTTSGFSLPVNINLKHDQVIRKFPSFEKSQKLNANNRDSAFGNSCKKAKSPVKQDKTFKSIISLGIGHPQKIKIPLKPVAISLKTSKSSLMRNPNSNKKLGSLIKRNPFLIDENDSVCDNTNNQSSRNVTKEADCLERVNNFGNLFSESQKKNKAILSKSLLNPNNMDYSTSMTSKVKTEMLDDSIIIEEELNQPSQVDLFNQSMVYIESKSSEQPTSLNSDFNEKNLNKKQFPVGTLNIFTKPVPVVVTDCEISGECSKNDAAQRIDILEKTIPQDQIVNPTKNLSLETQLYGKEDSTFYIVDNQSSSHQHQKQYKPKNNYIPFTPIGFIKTDTSNNKNCEEPSDKKYIIYQDLNQLIEEENRIELLPCEKPLKENHENPSDLKHLAQEYYISQNNQEKSQFLKTDICSNESNSVGINTDPILEEGYNLDEPLERGIDENINNKQSVKMLNNITSAENNFPPNNDNNCEKILPSKRSDSVKNGPVSKERFRVNIGTQTISKLLPVNTNLRLPKITLNCEKSWYTEHLSSEKKLLFLQILK